MLYNYQGDKFCHEVRGLVFASLFLIALSGIFVENDQAVSKSLMNE